MEANEVARIKHSNRQKLVWGLICLAGPTVLLILSILVYATANFIFAGSAPVPEPCPRGPESINMGICQADVEQDALFRQDGPVKTITNIVMFLVGAFAAITWLPGVIVGIILLATRKKAHAGNQS
ncbi:MAG TPA: hypothetical protein PK096_03100 [Candidatus Saccharibacteria bacterium]|nr:hypothetical protein [Candidatus Saccharibacteria bacterium]HRK94329.1 hypothetical protein [Candidatus Saccharibacteria bacterium]